MQFLENWDPLRLPKGSIRALVTLLVLAVVWTLLLLGRDIPAVLAYLSVLIVGYYFGARSDRKPQEGERPPLFLPRGSVRLLIVVGFALVAYLLWRDGRLRFDPADPAFPVILLNAALILGFLLRKAADLISRGRATRLRKLYENAKSVLVLAAAVLLAVVALFAPDDPRSETVLLIAAPLVGFYFGSRR